jgi:Icc protein
MEKKVILVSDIHYSANNDMIFNEYDAEQNFGNVKQLIVNENPDYIFLLGDLSQDGSISSYEKLKNDLAQFKCEIYYIPGNHDNLDNITTLSSNQIKRNNYVDILNHRFIFLNSYLHGSDAGYLSSDELSKINIYYNPDLNNHLIVHHHFIPLGGIIDQYIMTNANELLQILDKFNFITVFTGHVHNDAMRYYRNTQILHCPSTCMQFNLSYDLETSPNIGYRIIKLNEKNIITDYKILQV